MNDIDNKVYSKKKQYPQNVKLTDRQLKSLNKLGFVYVNNRKFRVSRTYKKE